jgi:curved DNA-binding protein CbpA
LYVIPILSTSSGILTGLSAKFNFEDKTFQCTREIDKLNKLKSKLHYVVHCDGNLTEQEYQQILSEFK